MDVCFVCTGNTCRSPMAQAIAAREIERRGYPFTASSAGIYASPGSPATPEAVEACAEVGLDISGHRAGLITPDMLSGDTLFAAMTRQHAQCLRAAAPELPEDRITVLGGGIADPYGGDIEVYRACRDRIYDAVTRLLAELYERESGGLVVRGAQASDAAAIAALERECFSQPWSESALREELDVPDSVLLIAEKGGCTAGYVGMQHTADTGYVTNICVLPKYRRQGVAAALLAELKLRGAAKGEREITLEVRASNRAAIALYNKTGFKSMGVRPGFYTSPAEDAVIMTAEIADERNS